MDFGFPSRFLRKLDIYQQIRSGQGLAKHKKLWPMERAFLKWGYEEGHQHLEVFTHYARAKKEIEKRCRVYDRKQVGHALGNLYFKGLTEVKIEKYKAASGKDVPLIINPKESKLEVIEERDNEEIRKHTCVRPSLRGLEVGEVISEIENEHIFTKYKNLCKYELTLSTVWLVLVLGVLKFVLGSFDNLLFIGCWYLAFFLLRVCQYLKRWGGKK